jgi:gpW
VSEFNINYSVFAGMSPTALQTALTNAQNALIALQSGSQVVTLSYGEGVGTKHVQYRAPEIGGLVQLINELQACLGLRRRARRAFGVSF